MSDQTLSDFDRLMGSLDGLPDVVHTKPSTIQVQLPLIGVSNAYIVQTYRQRDAVKKDAQSRDTIFLQTVSHEGTIRIAVPPEVADAIARQRDALSTKLRKKSAKAVAADRKARGIVPAFLTRKRT